MPRVAPAVPDESSILCEACGYTLDGLPPGGNCPECGRSIAESTTGDGRGLTAWEDPTARSPLKRFTITSCQIIFRPFAFFRSLTTRSNNHAATAFAEIYWAISSIFFAGAAYAHWNWYARDIGGQLPMGLARVGLLSIACYGNLWGITHLAARLTAWEARYRGIRLPRAVVLRGLHYHAAHYLPVAFVAWSTAAGYDWLRRRHVLLYGSGTVYLGVLCAEVVLAAAYLFWTYWIAMRNMMYANR